MTTATQKNIDFTCPAVQQTIYKLCNHYINTNGGINDELQVNAEILRDALRSEAVRSPIIAPIATS